MTDTNTPLLNRPLNRRSVLHGATLGGGGIALAAHLPAWARSGTHGHATKGMRTLNGNKIDLTIAESAFTVDGEVGHAITINGTIPAPLVRLREGETVRLVVNNMLDEDTSIHWHGLIVPMEMDGVPGVSFPGIKARSTFTYEFPIKQSGTYWYHSHSGLQEQLGHYGPLIIDPIGPDPVAYDREHVIVLSDWSFLHPHQIFARMKQEGGFFNRQKTTLLGRLTGSEEPMPFSERQMFAKMRMDPTDISDVTEAAYSFLINGHSAQENWTGLFRPGERVRLRIINSAAQTTFNVRIPGLPMTLVATDGINVRPVETDEFQIGNAETYDFIVEPENRAYTIVSEAIDRSGMGHATLAPRMGMRAEVPPLRQRPTLNMKDMGMGDHGSPSNMSGSGVGSSTQGAMQMDHGKMSEASAVGSGHSSMPGMGGNSATAGLQPSKQAMDHSAMVGMGAGASGGAQSMEGMDHGAMGAMGNMGDMKQRDRSKVPPNVKVGVGVDNIAAMPVDRTGDPGVGLENVGHRVLTYKDLVSLEPRKDQRPPTRLLQIHLTGNMERFMWSMDGEMLSENPEPYRFARNERVRMRLINDTMMTHPMHIHGHFWELVNGHGAHQPLKHTVKVLPGAFIDLDLTADAPGDWAFHCHLLYHMHAGMMRVVKVRPMDGQTAA